MHPSAIEAQRIAQANASPRHRRLADLEAWVDGSQYDGRPDWWTGGAGKDGAPQWERKPCVVYPVVDIAIQSNVDLCLGDTKFPSISVDSEEVDEEPEPKPGEPEPEDPVDDALGHYHEVSRFPALCREALAAAQGCGTSVAVYGARNGKPFGELFPAKWCEADFGVDGEVTRLVIQYAYVEEIQIRGEWVSRARLYRRVIDTEKDTVYLPADANADGIAPSWVVDTKASTVHKLGFCPAVWYAHMKRCQAVNVIDGFAIHTRITDEIQAHDIARSQWHTTALYTQPQVYEIGVTPGYSPTAIGRTAEVPATENGGLPGPNNPTRGGYGSGKNSVKARKKGPGHVWQYGNPDTKVGALTIPADALKAQQDNCSDLRIKIQEALKVVFLDPENIKFAATTSGKALQAIKQKQLDACDRYRDDFADGFIVPSVQIHLKLMRALGKSLRVHGIADALPVLLRMTADPAIEVSYGSYFAPDPAEQVAIINMVQAALKDTPLITRKVAVGQIADIFGVDDVGKLLAELEEEDAKALESSKDSLMNEALAFHSAGVTNGKNANGTGPGGGAKPGEPEAG